MHLKFPSQALLCSPDAECLDLACNTIAWYLTDCRLLISGTNEALPIKVSPSGYFDSPDATLALSPDTADRLQSSILRFNETASGINDAYRL